MISTKLLSVFVTKQLKKIKAADIHLQYTKVMFEAGLPAAGINATCTPLRIDDTMFSS